MPSERILICGAGVAGSVLAFWLAKANFEVVVIERSRAEQKLGQGIEIEEPAIKVVKRMGILDKLNEVKTGELGFDFLDEHDQKWAYFGTGGASPTGDLELMRGDLTQVLYKAADGFENVTYHFRTTIQSLRQTQDKVIVDLENRHDKSIKTQEFDLVIGADGQRSQTRQLIMGSPEELNCFKRVGAFVAYFSIPKEERDWPNSRFCNFPDRRCIWTRPTTKGSKTTSVALIHHNNDLPALRQANAAGDRLKQKEAFAELYAGLGWETPRIIEQMMKTDNFYSDELIQVKLKKWSEHRVVIVGDAAWAPSPFTGQGNQLAIIGAWVLAQELSRNRSPAAFEKFENRMRAYVESSQNIPLGGYAPWLFNPQTKGGIWVLRNFFWVFAFVVRFVVWTGVTKLFPDRQAEEFDLEMENEKVLGEQR